MDGYFSYYIICVDILWWNVLRISTLDILDLGNNFNVKSLICIN